MTRGQRARAHARARVPDARLISAGRAVLADAAAAVASLGERLGAEFAAAARFLAGAQGRVVLTGMGKAGSIGQKISATFASTGSPSYFLHPADAAHGDLGRVAAGDVLIALSHSGETEEVLRLIEPVRQLGASVVALTASRRSSLGKAADHTLELGEWREAGTGLAPTTSTTVMLALGDALAIAVLELRGFSEDEFRCLHPAGALARRLMRVEDVMRRGEMLPRIRQTATVAEALAVMTQTPGRPGATCVVDRSGRLVGLFTDGDLRRLIEADGFDRSAPVRSVMTRAPKSARAEQHVTEAAAILRAHAIDQVPVVDADGRPIGLLDVQDLLALRFLS